VKTASREMKVTNEAEHKGKALTGPVSEASPDIVQIFDLATMSRILDVLAKLKILSTSGLGGMPRSARSICSETERQQSE